MLQHLVRCREACLQVRHGRTAREGGPAGIKGLVMRALASSASVAHGVGGVEVYLLLLSAEGSGRARQWELACGLCRPPLFKAAFSHYNPGVR